MVMPSGIAYSIGWETDQLQLLLETLGHAVDDIVDQGTHGTGHRHGVLVVVGRLEGQDVVVLLEHDILVHGDRHLALRPLGLDILAVDAEAHATGHLDRLFRNSGHVVYLKRRYR